MRRRRIVLIVVAVTSTLAALVFAAMIVMRPAAVPRVASAGTIDPPSSSQARVDGPHATAATVTTVPTFALPPIRLSIPKIGVQATVEPVGVDPGTNNLQIPPIDRIGWYRFGPAPGDGGSAALVGHVDGDGRPGVFWKLRDLTPGDRINITAADGKDRAFRVVGRAETPKSELPPALFTRTGPPRVALITCGGAFDVSSRHYRDNVFVVAVPE